MEDSCRICCKSDPFEPVRLNTWSDILESTISDMFMYCTQLEVSTEDLLPQQICSQCLGNLTVAFEFRKLCRQSDAALRGLLRNKKPLSPPTVTIPVTSTQKNDQSSVNILSDKTSRGESPCSAIPFESGLGLSGNNLPNRSETNKLVYHCCITRCKWKTKEYNKLGAHAVNIHRAKRARNERGKHANHRFICSICMCGFSSRTQWKIHRGFIHGDQRLYKCATCGDSFDSDEQLTTHEAAGCQVAANRPNKGNIENVDTTMEANLVQRILDTKESDRLLLVNPDEQKLVINGELLSRLNSNELKHSLKQIRLYFVCENCSFRAKSIQLIETHLAIGKCTQGYYFALGFCQVSMRKIQRMECETCGYQCINTSNVRRHQEKNNHYGIRRTVITRPIAVRNLPCEYCGKVLTTAANRKRHIRRCSRILLKKETKNHPSEGTDSVSKQFYECNVNRERSISRCLKTTNENEDIRHLSLSSPKGPNTGSYNILAGHYLPNEYDDHQTGEPVVTEIKIEEFDALDIYSQSSNDEETEIEPEISHPSPAMQGEQVQIGKTRSCMICGYSTNKVSNLKRHIPRCLKKIPTDQSIYFSSMIERELASRRKKALPRSCDICGYSSKKIGNLNRHVKRCVDKLKRK